MLASPINVSTVAYQVLISRYATLEQLSTVYSLEDALNLIEVYQVENYNKQIIEEINNANSN